MQKIASKYGPYFHVLREKTVLSGGWLFGIGRREEVELEFYLSPMGTPQQAPDRTAQQPGAGTAPTGNPTLDFAEAKKKVLAAAGRDPERLIKEARLQDDEEEDGGERRAILDELREIRERLDSGAGGKKDPANLGRAEGLLRLNGFSEDYTAGLLERARKELSLDTLENFDLLQGRLLEWIGESIRVYRVPEKPPRKAGDGHSARVMVLVGPTGVGKTTTIAKLAAIYSLGSERRRPLSVRMITIDAFRMGAQHQIEKYAQIMEIPISFIDNNRDLLREIDLYREEADLILVDTTGRSPKDSTKLGEMQEVLDACGSRAEVHLVLSAGTKTRDLLHIMRQFEPFNYRAVLLTKLDETGHVGNVISALAEKDKEVSYITDGQSVPKDIKKASVIQFLINLEEFRVDREAFEKRFPDTEAEQFQWG